MINYVPYGKISSIIFHIPKLFSVKVNVDLFRQFQTKYGKKIIKEYQSEVQYYNDKVDCDIKKIQLNYDYNMSIESEEDDKSAIVFVMIRLEDMYMLRYKLMRFYQHFHDQYKTLFRKIDLEYQLVDGDSIKEEIELTYGGIAFFPSLKMNVDGYNEPAIGLYIASGIKSSVKIISIKQFLGLLELFDRADLYLYSQMLINFYGRELNQNPFIITKEIEKVANKIEKPKSSFFG